MDMQHRLATITNASPETIEVDEDGRRVYTALAYNYEATDTHNTTLARGAMAHVVPSDFRILEYHRQDRDPVGKPLTIDDTPDGPMVRFVFADTDRARELESLVSGGFLRAVSVGFIPTDGFERGDGVTVFTKADLLELSLVNAPSSKNALIQLARSVGAEPDDIAGLFPPVTDDDDTLAADALVVASADLDADADGDDLAAMVERLRALGVADDILARITDDPAPAADDIEPADDNVDEPPVREGRDADIDVDRILSDAVADARRTRILRNLELLRLRR